MYIKWLSLYCYFQSNPDAVCAFGVHVQCVPVVTTCQSMCWTGRREVYKIWWKYCFQPLVHCSDLASMCHVWSWFSRYFVHNCHSAMP